MTCDFCSRYEARRKGAYAGGADSLALPEHCMQGWQQTVRRGNKQAKKKKSNVKKFILY